MLHTFAEFVWFVIRVVFDVSFVFVSLTAFAAWVYRGNEPDWRLPDDEPVAPNVTAIIAWLWEWFVTSVKILILPFGWLAMPRRSLVPGIRPVVLVHGLGMNRMIWWWFARRLRRDGCLNLVSLNLPIAGGDLESHAQLVGRTVERALAESRCDRVDLVGHSMGGLVARVYATGANRARVRRIVTVGSPHKGTALAFMGPGAAAMQMRPGCKFLRDLDVASPAIREGAAPSERPFVVSLYSTHDNTVIPFRNAVLDGSETHEFSYLGHNALLVSDQVYRLLRETLLHEDSKS